MAVERIASLLSAGTEILYGLGLGERVVAISHECDWPPEVAGKPRVTSTRVAAGAASGQIDRQVRALTEAGEALYEIDAERLAALSPDLIVTQAQCDVCAVRYQDVIDLVERHESLRRTRVVALNPLSLDDIFADIVRVGEAAEVSEEATRFVAALQARVAAVVAKTKGLAENDRPRVAAIEWIDPVMIAGNWMPELIDLAGGQSGLAAAGRHSGYTPWRLVVEYDPEVILIMPCGFDLARTLAEAPALTALDGWNNLSAVQSGRVHAVDGNALFNRSGPRMVDSLELLAHLLHPPLIPAPTFDSLAPSAWRTWS